jgi:hypothetical protein
VSVGLSVYPRLLLGNNSVKAFPRQRRIFVGVVFYAVHVISKEVGDQFFLELLVNIPLNVSFSLFVLPLFYSLALGFNFIYLPVLFSLFLSLSLSLFQIFLSWLPTACLKKPGRIYNLRPGFETGHTAMENKYRVLESNSHFYFRINIHNTKLPALLK